LITSPRTNLKENWRKELLKWGLSETNSTDRWKIANNEDQILESGEVIRYMFIWIENIQTAYKWDGREFDLIIADEIHTMMTPEYSLLFKNVKYKYLMGLTATHDITNKNDKEWYYNKYCPVIFEYYDSADDGLINKTRFFIVNHSLNNNDKVIIRTKKFVAIKGEKEYYDYLTERIKAGQRMMLAQGSDDWFTDAAEWFWNKKGTPEQKRAAMTYLNSIKARKEFLLNLNSTAELAKRIKEGILNDVENSKVLIFSELTAQADKISRHTVHSNNKPETNENLIRNFNNGGIRDLGSCRSLTLGLNLKGATHAIMESYIGSATQSKQKKGRLDRLKSDDVAEMWIIRVLGTQSDSWFKEMTKGFDLKDAEVIDSKMIMSNGYDYKNKTIKSSAFVS
jgi:superfamily II DNA or RNA helicase